MACVAISRAAPGELARPGPGGAPERAAGLKSPELSPIQSSVRVCTRSPNDSMFRRRWRQSRSESARLTRSAKRAFLGPLREDTQAAAVEAQDPERIVTPVADYKQVT
jgi:hypothetical protein